MTIQEMRDNLSIAAVDSSKISLDPVKVLKAFPGYKNRNVFLRLLNKVI